MESIPEDAVAMNANGAPQNSQTAAEYVLQSIAAKSY